MTNERKKTEFEAKLKGDPIAYDAFGKAIFKGDIVFFAATVGRAAELRVIKILETIETTNSWNDEPTVKLRVRRAERGWGKDGEWSVASTKSIVQKLENMALIGEPPQRLIDLFEEAD